MTQQMKRLSAAELKKLKALEKQLGCCIVAVEPDPAPAKLSRAQVEELQTAEKEMDAVLLAYVASGERLE